MAKERYLKERYFDHVDSYLSNINTRFDALMELMPESHRNTFKMCLLSLFEIYSHAIDWFGLDDLNRFAGINPTKQGEYRWLESQHRNT